MPVKVRIPTPMREQSGGAAEVTVEAATVGAALQALVAVHPGLNAKLYDNGKLRPYVNVTLDDEDVRYLDDLDTAVADGQLIDLVPAVAGG
jgi:sulfur-carrier protein